MGPVRFLAWHPVLVLGALVTGFMAWVAVDFAGPRRQPSSPQADPPSNPPWDAAGDSVRMHAVGQSLLQVRPGMPRAWVEQLLGPPDPSDLRPVDLSGRNPVYQTSYRAILPRPHPDCPQAVGPCLVVLEFDAGRAGHPLARIASTPLLMDVRTVVAT
jgi:hypothetical protein